MKIWKEFQIYGQIFQIKWKNKIINYLKKIQFNGLFDAEFKKDPRDGNFKLIEINARSWWQNSFPTKFPIPSFLGVMISTFIETHLSQSISFTSRHISNLSSEISAKVLLLNKIKKIIVRMHIFLKFIPHTLN